jgi:hypothetical protein
MAIDNNDLPHVFGRVDAAGNIDHFFQTPGGGWSKQNTGLNGWVDSASIDSTGRVHIAYRVGSWPAYDVHHAVYDSVSWTQSFVMSGVAVRNVGLALDTEDSPHLVFGNGDNFIYAVPDNSAWRTEIVDSIPEQNVGLNVGIALDSNNQAHFCYEPGNLEPPKYATGQSGNWHIQDLPVAEGLYSGSSVLALDDYDQPHIAYASGSGSTDHRATHWTTDGLLSEYEEIVDSHAGASGSDIVIDSDGVHVLLEYKIDHGIYYAHGTPEPTTLSLLALGGLAMLKRKRGQNRSVL